MTENASAALNELEKEAAAAFEAVEEELQSISRYLYEHPEIAFEEHESSRRLVTFLRAHGFEVEYPAWGLDTAFDATAGSGEHEVVICAEYDALPEVGHACGHNIIAAAALGAGVALAAVADRLGIRVRVLGTPAEEAYGGKVDLIQAGAFASADAAMMIHPSVRDVVDPIFLAVAHLDVDYHGQESHAAFAPQLGVNALDAAIHAYVGLSMLRQALYPTDKLHGIITHGGGAPNVIPGHTSLAWYVRAATDARLEELRGQVEAIFTAAAQATGCQVEVSERGHTYTDLKSDPLLVDLYAEKSAALGRPMVRGAELDLSAAGSTDMGNVSYVVPTIHPMLDIHTDGAVNHQKAFADHTVTEDGMRAIRDGALAMAATVIELAARDLWSSLGQAPTD